MRYLTIKIENAMEKIGKLALRIIEFITGSEFIDGGVVRHAERELKQWQPEHINCRCGHFYEDYAMPVKEIKSFEMSLESYGKYKDMLQAGKTITVTNFFGQSDHAFHIKRIKKYKDHVSIILGDKNEHPKRNRSKRTASPAKTAESPNRSKCNGARFDKNIII